MGGREGGGYQGVLGWGGWELGYRDGREEGEEGVRRWLEGWLRAPFDLSGDYMLRGVLIRVSDREHLLGAVMHHIASDGWSLSVLVREVSEQYGWRRRGGTGRKEEELRVQYGDYAVWQRRYLSGAVLERGLEYWKERLGGVEALVLPTDRRRPAEQSTRGANRRYQLGRERSGELERMARREGVTLYMLLVAVFKVLLYRYTGQEDICVGLPIANRRQGELEGLIGFFANTLVLRSDLGGGPTFREVLGRVKEGLLEAYEHQDVPLEKVLEQVGVVRDMSRSPLFQVMFVLQNMPEVPVLRLGEVELRGEGYANTSSKFDLVFTINETGEGLELWVEYCTDLFEGGTIDRMAGHYQELLRSVLGDGGERIGGWGMLGSGEAARIREWNRTEVRYPAEATVVELFEEQVRLGPGAVAVEYEG